MGIRGTRKLVLRYSLTVKEIVRYSACTSQGWHSINSEISFPVLYVTFNRSSNPKLPFKKSSQRTNFCRVEAYSLEAVGVFFSQENLI